MGAVELSGVGHDPERDKRKDADGTSTGPLIVSGGSGAIQKRGWISRCGANERIGFCS